jgi:hypothetical protein
MEPVIRNSLHDRTLICSMTQKLSEDQGRSIPCESARVGIEITLVRIAVVGEHVTDRCFTNGASIDVGKLSFNEASFYRPGELVKA